MKPFRIPIEPETTGKHIEFPNALLEQVERAIENKNCSLQAFVVEAVRYALEHLETHDREQ